MSEVCEASIDVRLDNLLEIIDWRREDVVVDSAPFGFLEKPADLVRLLRLEVILLSGNLLKLDVSFLGVATMGDITSGDLAFTDSCGDGEDGGVVSGSGGFKSSSVSLVSVFFGSTFKFVSKKGVDSCKKSSFDFAFFFELGLFKPISSV